MTGFVRAMVAHAVPLGLPPGIELVDTCGTGGDRLRSINVSTIAALVVAATGAKVCKHGGRASSSAVGAADVLEALGVVADLGPAGVARCIDEVGMGFCFAPRFHPAMRFAGPVRRELGHPHRVQLPRPPGQPGAGPLPGGRGERSGHGRQDARRAGRQRDPSGHGRPRRRRPRRAEHHRTLHRPRADPPDGAERPTTTSRPVYRIDPADLGLARATLDDLRGGDASVNADAIREVIAGQPSPHRDIAVLNAAAALVVVGQAEDLAAGVDLACAVVDDGGAEAVLESLIRVSQAAAADEATG